MHFDGLCLTLHHFDFGNLALNVTTPVKPQHQLVEAFFNQIILGLEMEFELSAR